MTTIIIDTKRRLVASDSLMTTEYTKTTGVFFTKTTRTKLEYTKGMQKLYKLKNGVVLACCGNCGLTNEILNRFKLDHNIEDADCFSKGEVGRVLVTNPYNDTITVFTATAESDHKVNVKVEWLRDYANVRGGSGEEIAGKCFNKGIAIEDCIRYASYGDKYTGGELQIMGY